VDVVSSGPIFAPKTVYRWSTPDRGLGPTGDGDYQETAPEQVDIVSLDRFGPC